MSGTTPSAEPLGRSKTKKKRFGLFNLFGFSTDPETTPSSSVGPDADLNNNEGIQSQWSGLGIADNSGSAPVFGDHKGLAGTRTCPSDGGNIDSSASMIRTCPIPERLRLRTSDIHGYSAEINSPGLIVSSANTLTDSPRLLPDHRAHRRATVSSSGTGSTLDKDYHNAPRTPDQHLSTKRAYILGTSSHQKRQHSIKTLPSITLGAAAQRTSSNNSSWSVATPTSANDIPGDHHTTTSGASYSGYGAFVPDVDHASAEQQQQKQVPLTPSPLRSRAKGRRYSVFDVSFANQPRSESTVDSYSYSGGAAIPITMPIHTRQLRRDSLIKSSTGADGQSAHENTSFAPLRRSSQQSNTSISTFSSQGNILDEESQDSRWWHRTADERRTGSKHFYSGYQDLSSGQSTASQTPSTPTRPDKPRGVISANTARRQSPKLLKEAARPRTGSLAAIVSKKVNDLINGHSNREGCLTSSPESLDTKAPSSLRYSTSLPEVALANTFSCIEEYADTLVRPDYYYEQILDDSRCAKASRWRHNSPASDWKSPAMAYSFIDSGTEAGKEKTRHPVSGPQTLDISTATTIPFPVLEKTRTSPHSVSVDPSRVMEWRAWTDELCNRPETLVTAQAAGMWQRILRNWRYRLRGDSDWAGHRYDNSGGYIGNLGIQTTPNHTCFADNGNDSAATGTTFSPASSSTSNSPAIFVPVEPTYLQRGSSESGRYGTPISPLVPLYPMGQARRSNKSGALSRDPTTSSIATTTTPQQTLASDSGSEAIGGRDVSLVSLSEPSVAALCGFVDEISQTLQPAPHRRLSIIKSQELGIHRAPTKPNSEAGTGTNSAARIAKAPRDTAGVSLAAVCSEEQERADATSIFPSSRAAEKEPIVIAQLEPADQVVDTLYSFFARLRLRLEKAKAESENELLRIIQDLGSFVEDGLSYVNEDTDPSELNSVYNAAPMSEEDAPHMSGDDDGNTHTPGLVITRKSLSDEQHKRHLHHGAMDSGSDYLSPFEPEIVGNSRISARHGLESLNDRLHDMLDNHSGRTEGSSNRASSAGPAPRDIRDSGIDDAVSLSQLQLDSAELPQLRENTVRSHSICGIASLLTSASGADKSLISSTCQDHYPASARGNASRSVDPDFPDLKSHRRAIDRHSITERSSSQASIHSTGSHSSLAGGSPLIEEDRFKPTPLIVAIMDLVNIIGCVINLSADDMLHPISSQLFDEALGRTRETNSCFDVDEEREHVMSMMPTEYLIQQLDALGSLWQRPLLVLDDEHSGQQQRPWPCRGLFFRALLAISSLNRIVMWYVAMRSTYSEDIIEQLDKRTHVDSLAGSPGKSLGKAGDGLSGDLAPSDTVSIPNIPLDEADSQGSAGIYDPNPVSKYIIHDPSREPDDVGTASTASGSGLYQEESPWNPTDGGADVKSCDIIGRPSRSSEAENSLLNTAVFDKGLNMLLEIALDGRIRYISPTCRQLLGADPESVINLPATAIFDADDAQMCRSAVEQLLADSTRTVEISIKIHGPGSPNSADVEAKGMLIYSRAKSEPSHVLWVLRYVNFIQAGTGTYSRDSNAGFSGDDDLLQTLEPITCRICDMSVPTAYFEEHTWLCAKSHRAAMDVCRQNDRLSDLKTEIQAWYPGCDIDDLEALAHGETSIQALHAKQELRAAEIGSPTWQNLVSEASAVSKSLLEICLCAIAIDEKDGVPKCEFPDSTERGGAANSSGGSDNSKDFVRSHLWTKVADYRTPPLEYMDDSLQTIQVLLLDAIREKLGAIDALQYAIVDSSVALSRWVPSESGLVDQDEHTHSEQQLNDPPTDIDAYTPVSGSAEYSVAQEAVPSSSQPVCATMKPSNMLPSASRSSEGLDSASNSSRLRIVTKDLHPTFSRSQTRSSISSNALLATPTMPTINDFTLLKPISKGAYGSVYLAKKRTTGEYYAIKVLRKADMVAKNQISNVKAERAIMMAQTGSPFVVRLLYTFQSRTSLYLVMEYLNGGDCASLLKAIGTLPEDWARQYLAEVVLGIQDLHARNVVHRDLKPDNLLIDSEGHLKLTDFGLSKLGFLGRRVDQQTVNGPLQSDEIPARQSRTQETTSTIGSSSIPSIAQSLPSTIPYNIYSQGTISGYRLSSSNDEEHLGNTSPSLDSAHGDHVSSTSSNGASLPIANRISGKYATSLKPASNRSSLSDSNGGCAAPSLSSSTSLRSDDLDAAVAPNQHNKHALGTPDYIAPESILGLETGKSVDWWALGIICYEFIFGIPPFHDETPELVFKNILSSDIDFYDDLREQLEVKRERQLSAKEDMQSIRVDEDEPDVPFISPETRDFITKLLCRDPKRRLGYNGTEEVKAHPMFKGVDWRTILETQAAFIPTVDSIEDTGYFDSRGASMDDHESVDHRIDDDQQPDNDSVYSDTTSDSGESQIVSHPEPLTSEDAKDEWGELCRRENRQHLPSEDEIPGSEFGLFTFKNLHVLEQANMDELVRLRRRSTMLDVSTAPAHNSASRTSFSFGPSSPTSLSPLTQTMQQSHGSETLQNYRPQKSSRLSLAGVPSEAPLFASPQTQHNRGSLLNPNIQTSLHGQKSPVVAHGSSIYRPATTGELHSEPRAPSNVPAGSAYVQSTVCLVADDNPVCCKIMEVMLRRLHLQCVIVRNGAEALRIAMGRTAFRAIFMDTGMPIVDGDEATRMIKSTYNINKDTPIIAMTAYEGEAADALYDGAIVKPATLSHVKKELGLHH
ncbi:rim15, signal transduction response regulator [Coemansia sp. RSA 1933]|nr:rim15, signal transduction response regulator [Coemansia sp. RSA 1933]